MKQEVQKHMLGIYDCFGYGGSYDVLFAERYRRIKRAGFDCVMLWWSDRFGRGAGYQEDALLARQAELVIENVHAPVHGQNSLFQDDLAGESVFRDYLQCVEDCFRLRIPTVVIHLPNDRFPISELGMQRLKRLIDRAEDKDVQIAFENLGNIRNLNDVLNRFPSANAGLCYDSCHHQNYAPEAEVLRRHGSRLMALHLHDNGGPQRQHQLPFDGHTDWENVMRQIALTGYAGATTLEPMNWGYEHLTMQEFLARAYQSAARLQALRDAAGCADASSKGDSL